MISGGQTGVDRPALDAALMSNIPAGGFCPKGRRAEDWADIYLQVNNDLINLLSIII